VCLLFRASLYPFRYVVAGNLLSWFNPSFAFALPLVVVSVPFGCSVLDSKGFYEGSSSLGAAALGERLCLSLLVMAESGAPMYPSESKSVFEISPKFEGR
jgi:hypothetical protein